MTSPAADPCSRAGGIHAEEAPVKELEGADREQWQKCQEKLKGMGFEEEETDKLLRKAFGWAGQGYWRKSKVNEVPSQEQVCHRSRNDRSVSMANPMALTSQTHPNCITAAVLNAMHPQARLRPPTPVEAEHCQKLCSCQCKSQDCTAKIWLT